MKKRFFKAVAAVTAMTLVSGIFTGCGNSGSGKDGSSGNGELVFVDWGGANTDARIASAVKPFEEQTGIKVTVVTPCDYAKLISMVENNTTEWDVMNCDAYWGVYAGEQGYLEPIDYNVVTTKIDEEAQLEYVMGAEIYTSVIFMELRQDERRRCSADMGRLLQHGKIPRQESCMAVSCNGA